MIFSLVLHYFIPLKMSKVLLLKVLHSILKDELRSFKQMSRHMLLTMIYEQKRRIWLIDNEGR